MFCGRFFEGIEPGEKELILEEIQESLRPTNYINNQWIADYQRLRILAVKP